jgi:Flp pilus assembly protein TadG
MARLSWHRLWRSEDGVSAIEFAVVGGALSLLLLGVLDFGVGYWDKVQVGDAARAGADYAERNAYDSTKIQSAITNATTLSGIQASPAPSSFCGCPDITSGVGSVSCTTTCSDGTAAGTYVTVYAQKSYSTIFAWPGVSNPTTLSSSVTVRID